MGLPVCALFDVAAQGAGMLIRAAVLLRQLQHRQGRVEISLLAPVPQPHRLVVIDGGIAAPGVNPLLTKSGGFRAPVASA